jgi:hypothetical protein
VSLFSKKNQVRWTTDAENRVGNRITIESKSGEKGGKQEKHLKALNKSELISTQTASSGPIIPRLHIG